MDGHQLYVAGLWCMRVSIILMRFFDRKIEPSEIRPVT